MVNVHLCAREPIRLSRAFSFPALLMERLVNVSRETIRETVSDPETPPTPSPRHPPASPVDARGWAREPNRSFAVATQNTPNNDAPVEHARTEALVVRWDTQHTKTQHSYSGRDATH